jgi:protoporphyrinogen oxidase
VKTPSHLLVLGGGVAGLSVGFYARRRGLRTRLVEAGGHPGGHARTLQQGPFRFDTGAHRFHDRYPEVTADVQTLVGTDLVEVQAPSQIYANGTFVDFPLRPLNVMRSLGPRLSGQAAWCLASSRLAPRPSSPSFETAAVRAYGQTIADLFLLNYSRKLWGIPGARLDPAAAGQRLNGLSARVMLKELLWKSKEQCGLEGRFFYPKFGIGTIADRLAASFDDSAIRLNSRVTQIAHRDGRIVSVEINGSERIDTNRSQVVSTLPLTLLGHLMTPALPPRLMTAVRGLRFRNVVLVTIFLDRPTVSPNATLYFPESRFLFTRVSEPRNRSPHMSPPGMTSLSIEIPCSSDDEAWRVADAVLIARCGVQLRSTGLLRAMDRIRGVVHRIPYAYPVLEIGMEMRVRGLIEHLARFDNLHVTGRAGLFDYSSLHDLLRAGRALVERIADGQPASDLRTGPAPGEGDGRTKERNLPN